MNGRTADLSAIAAGLESVDFGSAGSDFRRRLKSCRFLPQGRRLPADVWAGRHKLLTLFLGAHIAGLYAFALLRGYSLESAATECSILVAALLLASFKKLSRNVRSASTSLGLVIAASLSVHLANGALEAHFEFFVVLAFLTLYQAWLPFLLALGYVFLEHGVLGAMAPRSVYNNPADMAHPWRYAAIHGGFVLAASFANLLSWRLTEQSALHDSLTGLPNRAFFLEALEGTVERPNAKAAVIFLDLDNFKDANDGFGHEIGDRLLQLLTERLQGEVADGDLLARLGGDEFALVLRGLTGRAEGLAVAERVLAVVAEPAVVDGITLTPSCSIGLAFYDGHVNARGLLRDADLAMYAAKRLGGARVEEFQPELRNVALRRSALEAELRVAIAERQFVLYYQPIVDFEAGALVGFEALVRWAHPTRGLLPPAQFIPLAEESGLVVEIGRWVLHAACRQTAQLQRSFPHLPPLSVAVNLAPRQLADPRLLSDVAAAVREADLDPTSLCLEVTEGSVIRDFEKSLETLNALRELGIRLALDDFGTGYSSLSYLQRLPVTSVKIDRSFVDRMAANAESREIVRVIINLAHALGLSVTAEGIETTWQREDLRAMGADRAQGYLLSKPLPADELTLLVQQSAARSGAAGAVVRPRTSPELARTVEV